MDIFINKIFYNYYQRNRIRLIDAGASGGLPDNWKRAESHLEVIAFEPDKRSFTDLEKASRSEKIYINSALYKDRRTLDFYLMRKQQLSSIFAPKHSFLKQFPESERYQVTKVLKIEVDSLDNQLEKHHVDDADFIKLDTQGSELSILEGATKTLNDVLGLEIEVEFAQIYEGQPVFSDIDKFIRGFGFQLFDLRPYYWKRKTGSRYGGLKGQIIFADAIYLLDLERIIERLSRTQDSALRKSKALRAISIAFLYGYLDYALAIFEQQKVLFNTKETESFYQEIKKNVPLSIRIPYFRGRGRIARLFKILYSIFRPHYHNWAISEEHLGNLK